MPTATHNHSHSLNRFAVIPTVLRLNADASYTGNAVTIAFLDSGFYPHPDIADRILAYHDLNDEQSSLDPNAQVSSWQWHGTQTSVVAAGDGQLSQGTYCGLAEKANVVLVKVSEHGRISEEAIARGIDWVIAHREQYNIRILSISLGGDQDVPCTQSTIDQAAERAIENGITVVAAAGNSGHEGRHSLPPANSPAVITVGGYTDNNRLDPKSHDLYHSNFGVTVDGTLKPEIIAPAMWVAAPILPNTGAFDRAEALSELAAAPDFLLPTLARKLSGAAKLPKGLTDADTSIIRQHVDETLKLLKIVAAHYQHVDGTSFAAPIVASVIAQMIEANPRLTPGAIKNILISTATRIGNGAAIRQGYGVVNAARAVELARNETHALNVRGCSPPRVENGRLVFVYHDDYAEHVAVAGEFNGWDHQDLPLRKDENGLWHVEAQPPGAGRYQYKFVVNGHRWTEDPNNGMKVPDNFGGLNSLLVIE